MFSYSQVLGKVSLISQKKELGQNRLKKNAWELIHLLDRADIERSGTFSLKTKFIKNLY